MSYPRFIPTRHNQQPIATILRKAPFVYETLDLQAKMSSSQEIPSQQTPSQQTPPMGNLSQQTSSQENSLQEKPSQEKPSPESSSKEVAYQAPSANGGVPSDTKVEGSYTVYLHPSHSLEAHMATVGLDLKHYITGTMDISDGFGLIYLVGGVDHQLLSLIRADPGVTSVDCRSFGVMEDDTITETDVDFDFDDFLVEN